MRPSVVTIVEPPERSIVTVDMQALTAPDPVMLDALVRLQLAARRLGSSIRLQNACAELVDLLELVGLTDVLPVLASGVREPGVEVDRAAEQGEEVLVDEEVDPGDASG